MRVSQGMPFGVKAMLYDPDSFQDHEEVIIYEREEFRRAYMIMRESVKDIFLMDHVLGSDDNRSLMGHWPWIMEKIHIINLELDSFIIEKPSQAYLDTYLHNPVGATEKEILESLSKISEKFEEDLGESLDWL